jgi:hypothetical protein
MRGTTGEAAGNTWYPVWYLFSTTTVHVHAFVDDAYFGSQPLSLSTHRQNDKYDAEADEAAMRLQVCW